MEAHVVQGAAVTARPGDPFLAHQAHEQVELLFEQPVILADVVSEQRERVDGGCPSQDELGAPVGDPVDGGELLIQPYRVLRGQHGDGGTEVDRRGRLGCRGEQHGGCRVDETFPVVLADAEDVKPDGFGQLGLLDDQAEGFRVAEDVVAVGGDFAEGVEPELEAGRVDRGGHG